MKPAILWMELSNLVQVGGLSLTRLYNILHVSCVVNLMTWMEQMKRSQLFKDIFLLENLITCRIVVGLVDAFLLSPRADFWSYT